MSYLINFKLKTFFIFSTFIIYSLNTFSQDYKKIYNQNINYNTGNKNGKDITLDFACKYDVFMGEPLFSSRTKKISEGDFVVYNGKKYLRSEIGEDIFNKINVGLINVSFDIYQGNVKITTVYLKNEISVSFIPGSPDWDKMWPGVSEKKAKQIWKDGYSIRNAKLYNVKFNGFYALESYLKKKELKIKKEKEEAEKKALAEKQRIIEENKLKEEKKLKEKEEAQKLQEDKESKEKLRLAEEQRKKEEAKERERKRKEEEERKRKERISAYNSRIANQRKENNAIAASAASSSASFLYLVGGLIYNQMGLPADQLYTGNNFRINFDFGYGLSIFPMANSSETTGIDFNGNQRTSTSNEPTSSITVDLRLALKIGYEMENAGGNIFGRFEPGFSPVFTGFNTSYAFGGEVFGGLKNIKLYGSYESGSHNFTSNNWLDPEEIGEGGKSNTKYQQIRTGLRFSYYRNYRTAKRDHLILGVMENYFDSDASTIFSFRDNPDKPFLNLISTPSNADLNPFIATGYFFEWKRDHTHRLFIEVFPNYPITGEIGGSSGDGELFLKVGFVRSLDAFFSK